MAPTVIVPVLSNTTVRMSRACSKALADVTSTPFVAPRPVAAVTDSGVASPSAQGHAMINTLTAVTSAWASLGCGPNVIHMAPVHNAAIITAGTNTRAILVGQTLHGRFGCLCACDQSDDLGEHRVLAGACDLHDHIALLHDGRPRQGLSDATRGPERIRR